MSEGDVYPTMCQPIVMMFALPCHAELTSTMGPGSRKLRISSTGKSLFAYRFTASRRLLQRGHEENDLRFPHVLVGERLDRKSVV